MSGPLLGAVALAILVMQSAAQPESKTPWPPAGVFRAGNGVTLPRLIKDVKAEYTADAMRAKIRGTVWMEAVVESDGSVGEVRVTRSLDRKFGLDDECVSSLKKWRFAPGMKTGCRCPCSLPWR